MQHHDEQTPARRIKVLWLIKGLGPGGAEHLLLDHARHGDADRFEYRAVHLLSWKSHLVAPLQEAGVDVACLDVQSALDLRWLVRLARQLREWRPDVVHVHSPLLAAFVRVLVRLRRRRPALLYTDHNRWGQYRLPTRLANALTYPLDDAQVAVAEGVAVTVPKQLRRNVQVILNGIDVTSVRSRADRDGIRDEFGIDEDAVVVGTVANLRPAKDYPNLLHAAKEVLADHPDVVFLSVGQGPLEREIRDLHRDLGLGERFRLLGYRKDAVRVMSGCDVFTLASNHEGFPLAMMEAMALGLPIVATSVGGIPEAVTDSVNGRLVQPHDSAALAAALEAVVGDEEIRRSMGQAAHQRSERFDSRPAIARLDAMYADLARERVAEEV